MHFPVLLNEVIHYLDPKPGAKIIDATISGGGHAMALLEKISNGKLLGLEWDPQIYADLKYKLEHSNYQERVILKNTSYTHIAEQAEKYDLIPVDGILFDLGISSWHFEASGRGFSFQRDEPLDMRFDPLGNPITAAEIINKYSEQDLQAIIHDFGEERFAKSIARAIVKARKEKPIISTFQLVKTIRNGMPVWYQKGSAIRKIHFATRTFQALRIAVNRELSNITAGLKQAINLLKRAVNGTSGGKVLVITFHSLEDRIVKHFFKEKAAEKVVKILTKKPIMAGETERRENYRSRSAKLRVAERI